jgi:hypothetical protein
MNKNVRIAYLADSLPPILKTSSNRNLSIIVELAKKYELHVFTLATPPILDGKYFEVIDKKRISIWSILGIRSAYLPSIVQYILRWSRIDAVNFRYINKMAQVGLENKFDLLIVSVGPFNRLRVGHDVSKKLKIPWIIDYRDEMTSAGSLRIKAKKRNFLRFIDKLLPSDSKMERRCVSSASAFISVHQKSVENISSHIKKKGFVIANGFFERDLKPTSCIATAAHPLRLAYWGTIYESQNMNAAFAAFATLLKKHNQPAQIDFFGTQKEIFDKLKNEVECSLVKFTLKPPIATKELFEGVVNYHALIHSEYSDNPHIPSSKLYDYVASGMPIVLLNNCGGYISKVLQSTNQLITLEDGHLVNFINSQASRERFAKQINLEARIGYSREEAVKGIKEVIDFVFLPTNRH